MSEPAKSPGLLASLRQLMATVLETAQLRLALLSNEIEQEKLRLFDGLLWAGLALLLLGLGALLLCAFIVVLFWDSHRLLALGTLALLFLGAGSLLLARARTRLQSQGGLFQSSATELGRDRAGLDTGE
ncbi:phage holin family protein [Rhodoferax sp. BAB1]|uniref:phage holin family protein n=1 Tax=Rhodoferax sp. BAB1 TaxID=2741720 RepID=UPI00157718AF|nr:phage holin family protein [Rhodoferax sp. BAB1]QKO20922.1 phage holin family protein [Rhodoferax sp. BAB1]